MNVQELIEVLGKAPPDMDVFVDGYESGYELLTWEMVCWVHLRRSHPSDFMGEYQKPHAFSKNAGTKGVLLSRHEAREESEMVDNTPMVGEPRPPLWSRVLLGIFTWAGWALVAGWVLLMIYVKCCAL